MTTGRGFFRMTAGAPPHDWLNNMGGSIGLGMPLATGAAVACPDRKVVCLEGDGSGMYTVQALWTQARENLDVTTVVFANRTYAILHHELAGVGAGTPGKKAADMLDIGRPDLDWVAMARGMGVEASRATTTDEFNRQFAACLAAAGPASSKRCSSRASAPGSSAGSARATRFRGEVRKGGGAPLRGLTAVPVRRRAGHVERGVTVEEARGLEHEADRGHRHHRPVLGPHDVMRAERVPEHTSVSSSGASCRTSGRQARPARVLVRILARGIALARVVTA